MNLGWKRLIPLAILNILITGGVMVLNGSVKL
jgi:NADH:ubiquinone oxidoreductase subunit H